MIAQLDVTQFLSFSRIAELELTLGVQHVVNVNTWCKFERVRQGIKVQPGHVTFT